MSVTEANGEKEYEILKLSAYYDTAKFLAKFLGPIRLVRQNRSRGNFETRKLNFAYCS